MTDQVQESQSNNPSSEPVDQSVQAVEKAVVAEQPKQEVKQPAFQQTDNPSINAALRILSRAGVNVNSPIVQKAVSEGDVSGLASVVNYIGVEDGGIAIQILEAEGAKQRSAAEAKRTQEVEAIYAAVGGKDQWDSVMAYAKATMSKDELDEFASDLDAGGKLATYRARDVAKAMAASGWKPETKETVEEAPVSTSSKPASNKPLTRGDYLKEIKALYKQGKDSTSPEYAAINLKYASIL